MSSALSAVELVLVQEPFPCAVRARGLWGPKNGMLCQN